MFLEGIRNTLLHITHVVDHVMNIGTILAFLIGTYASFAIAVMAVTPLVA